VAVRAAAAQSANLPGFSHPVAGNFKPDDTVMADCKDTDFACVEQAFGNIAYKQGPKVALDLVTKMLAENAPAVRGDCHTIAHLIGSATLARFKGDAAAAMGQGSMVCGSGYYHGLIEYTLLGTRTEPQLVAKVKSMCSDRKALNTTFLLYQCVHGLGHGVMVFSADNLPWALTMCSKLENSWMQQSCSGGVFMQNFNLPSKLSPFQSIYVKKNDLLYPCDWVAAKYKFYCYLQVTEHILYATNYDWQKTASICAGAGKPWSAICFQSYGRDASGASAYNPQAAYEFCSDTGPGLADCVYGVVRDFTNNDANGRRAAQFCALVPTNVRGYCFYGVGTILSTFGHDKAWIASTCRTLSAEYANECQGILTNAERKLITNVPTT
jgi:hypothetical protein